MYILFNSSSLYQTVLCNLCSCKMLLNKSRSIFVFPKIGIYFTGWLSFGTTREIYNRKFCQWRRCCSDRSLFQRSSDSRDRAHAAAELWNNSPECSLVATWPWSHIRVPQLWQVVWELCHRWWVVCAHTEWQICKCVVPLIRSLWDKLRLTSSALYR